MQGIEVVTTDVYILAVLILRLRVMLCVRANHRSSIQRRQHTGIALTEEVVATSLTRYIHLWFNRLAKLVNVKQPLVVEALGKVLT